MDPTSTAIAFFRDNWAVITQNPWLFVGLVPLCFSAGFGVRSWLASNASTSNDAANAAKDERLALAEDRVADYKEKLEGRSPDQAASAIASLEARIAALEPWVLNTGQLTALSAAISTPTGSISIMRDVGSVGLDPLFGQVAAAFRGAGWTTEAFVSTDGGTFDEPSADNGKSSITLCAGSGCDSEVVAAIRRGLAAAGLPFKEAMTNAGSPQLVFSAPV